MIENDLRMLELFLLFLLLIIYIKNINVSVNYSFSYKINDLKMLLKVGKVVPFHYTMSNGKQRNDLALKV